MIRSRLIRLIAMKKEAGSSWTLQQGELPYSEHREARVHPSTSTTRLTFLDLFLLGRFTHTRTRQLKDGIQDPAPQTQGTQRDEVCRL
jgi:hypothetical protein